MTADSYRAVRRTLSTATFRLQSDFTWLPRTDELLRKLNVVVPPGYTERILQR